MAAYIDEDLNEPAKYFQVKAYAGSEGTDTISLDSDVMQPDMVWIKDRGTTAAHTIQDAVRGFNAANKLSSNHTSGENDSEGATWENYGHVSAVASSSFTVVEGDNTPSQVNDGGGDTYIAWCWKESATAGFDIITWTVPSSGSTTISHSLSAVPQMIISKSRSNATDWEMYHHTSGNDNTNQLNTTAVPNDNNAYNDTDPTSSVFSVTAAGFGADRTMVTYAFAPKQGFSKFGKFSANNNAAGPFIYTGFRPAWLGMKRTDSTENWYQNDNKRDPFNPVDGKLLLLNKTDAEISTSYPVDFLANGFKIRGANNITNASSGTYLYFAWAEAPFVNSKGVPGNAR